jgi:hypothetical protein
LEREEDCLERERKATLAVHETALRTAMESMACAKRLEKQQRFLKSKGKDMLRCGLKTLDKLEEAEEKERQMEAERAATEAAARPSSALAPRLIRSDPFANLEVPLLPPKVWAKWDSLYGNLQSSQGN